LIPRYTRPEMGRIWSEENRFRTWLEVEVAATETLAEAGMVPKEAARAIRERADFSVDRINEIEAEVRHDVIAFTTAVDLLRAVEIVSDAERDLLGGEKGPSIWLSRLGDVSEAADCAARIAEPYSQSLRDAYHKLASQGRDAAEYARKATNTQAIAIYASDVISWRRTFLEQSMGLTDATATERLLERNKGVKIKRRERIFLAELFAKLPPRAVKVYPLLREVLYNRRIPTIDDDAEESKSSR